MMKSKYDFTNFLWFPEFTLQVKYGQIIYLMEKSKFLSNKQYSKRSDGDNILI